jgi:hypothetical protein
LNPKIYIDLNESLDTFKYLKYCWIGSRYLHDSLLDVSGPLYWEIFQPFLVN